MTTRQKPDAQRIKRFLSNLKNAEWLGSARRWWPDFLFHVTDIQNAVSILRTGMLLSRQEAQGLMVTDNASPDIIARTEDRWKNYVRLYFRPRTPTHFRSEGFRPRNQRSLNAHCPVPVCFLFDSYSILSRAGSQFSNGNLATSNAEVFHSAADIERMPFEYIYYDSRPPEDKLRDITFHRNAEVIVPEWLDLSSLRFIACRSQSEYETFLYLLSSGTRARWGNRIGLLNHLDLFEKQWTYVETVELGQISASFHFNRSSSTPGPFHARVDIADTLTDRRLVWEDKAYTANDSLALNLANIGPLRDYSVTLTLDGQLAYAGRYQQDDLLPW